MTDVRAIIDGDPGTYWTNNTDKPWYQLVCSLYNTCGICYQYHLKIARAWAVPLHHGCRCRIVVVKVRQTAPHPFCDYEKLVKSLDAPQQAAVMGRSLFTLWTKGIVDWSEAVTPGRIRSLREVVSRQKLSVKAMVKSGVSERIATKAYSAVHTAEHQAVAAQRKQLLEQIAGAGVHHEAVVKHIGEALASRVTIAAGPSYTIRPPVLTSSQQLQAIPADVRPEKLGRMAINPAASNRELETFRERHPNAKIIDIPITGPMRDKVMEHLDLWRRTGLKDELAKVRSILSADNLPPPIVHFYGDDNPGIPDGFHRIAAYVLDGRTSIQGYALGDIPATAVPWSSGPVATVLPGIRSQQLVSPTTLRQRHADELARLLGSREAIQTARAALSRRPEPKLPVVEPSKAKLVHADEGWERVAEKIIGRPVTHQEIFNLAGAGEGAGSISIAGDADLTISIHSDRYSVFRTLRRNLDDQPILSATSFIVKEGYQGQGIGADVFARMVQEAQKLKLHEIRTYALRRGTEANGYITWPKFGYDGPIPSEFRKQLPTELSSAKRLSDLMATPEGTAWWKTHGDSIDLTFDPKPGSKSIQVWDEYRKAKAQQKPPTQ